MKRMFFAVAAVVAVLSVAAYAGMRWTSKAVAAPAAQGKTEVDYEKVDPKFMPKSRFVECGKIQRNRSTGKISVTAEWMSWEGAQFENHLGGFYIAALELYPPEDAACQGKPIDTVFSEQKFFTTPGKPSYEEVTLEMPAPRGNHYVRFRLLSPAIERFAFENPDGSVTRGERVPKLVDSRMAVVVD